MSVCVSVSEFGAYEAEKKSEKEFVRIVIHVNMAMYMCTHDGSFILTGSFLLYVDDDDKKLQPTSTTRTMCQMSRGRYFLVVFLFPTSIPYDILVFVAVVVVWRAVVACSRHCAHGD